MRVLFLSAWYPTERDPMFGLFVQKHAEAVQRLGADVRVIYNEKRGLAWWLSMRRELRTLLREGWRPDVTQVNVNGKNALVALWLKLRYGIPYIILEHWSGYLPENGQFRKLSWWKRQLLIFLCSKASAILTVSESLKNAMQICGIRNHHWEHIDNVVDDFFFIKNETHGPKNERPKTLLHISCFDERAKQVKGLLRAAKVLACKRQDWCLRLIGTGIDYQNVREYAESLNIPDGILHWTGELSPRQVAEELHDADAFILTSRFETYGIVLAEAFVAGLPILSTSVGIAQELGATLIPQEEVEHHAEALAERIQKVLWNQERPIHTDTNNNRFSSITIGKKLMEIYDRCLHRNL